MITIVSRIKNSTETKFGQSFQLSQVRNKSRLSYMYMVQTSAGQSVKFTTRLLDYSHSKYSRVLN